MNDIISNDSTPLDKADCGKRNLLQKNNRILIVNLERKKTMGNHYKQLFETPKKIADYLI